MLYNFNELNATAKMTAIEYFNFQEVIDDCWVDDALFDITKEIKKKFGLDLDFDDIYFSGNCDITDPIDGVVFVQYNIDIISILKAVNKLDRFAKLCGLVFDGDLTADVVRVTLDNGYSSVEVELNIDDDIKENNKLLDLEYDELVDTLTDVKNQVCRMIYDRLRVRFAELTSYENVVKYIIKNEKKFTHDGILA